MTILLLSPTQAEPFFLAHSASIPEVAHFEIILHVYTTVASCLFNFMCAYQDPHILIFTIIISHACITAS